MSDGGDHLAIGALHAPPRPQQRPARQGALPADRLHGRPGGRPARCATAARSAARWRTATPASDLPTICLDARRRDRRARAERRARRSARRTSSRASSRRPSARTRSSPRSACRRSAAPAGATSSSASGRSTGPRSASPPWWGPGTARSRARAIGLTNMGQTPLRAAARRGGPRGRPARRGRRGGREGRRGHRPAQRHLGERRLPPPPRPRSHRPGGRGGALALIALGMSS